MSNPSESEEHPVENIVTKIVEELLNTDGSSPPPSFLHQNEKSKIKNNIRIEPLFKSRRSSSCSSVIELESNMKKRALRSPNTDQPAKRLLSQREDDNIYDENQAQELQTALNLRMEDRSHGISNDDWFNNDYDKVDEKDSSFKTLGSDFNSSNFLSEDPVPQVPKDVAHLAVMNAIQKAVNEAIKPIIDQMIAKSSIQNIINEAVDPLSQKIEELTKMVAQLTTNKSSSSKPTKPFSRSKVHDEQIFNPNLVVETSAPLTFSQTLRTKPHYVPAVVRHNEAQPNSTEQTIPMDNPAFELARKCQGFHPIDSRDIGRIGAVFSEIEDDEERFQETGKRCIRNFLKDEMKMSDIVVGDIRIKSVFYPPAGAGSATLFAEFYSEDEVKLIKSYSKNLVNTEAYKAKLVIYVPRSLQERLRAVEAAAFKIRRDSSKTFMTRIWISTDIELRAKKKGDSSSWASIPPILLPSLPPQAPKRPWKNLDVLDQRTPATPYFTSEDIRTFNSFNLLEDNCNN